MVEHLNGDENVHDIDHARPGRLAAGMPPDAADRPRASADLDAGVAVVTGRGAEWLAAHRTEDPMIKIAATLKARAALAGYELVQLGDGTWIASRWGMFRSMDTITDVERFLSRVGAPA